MIEIIETTTGEKHFWCRIPADRHRLDCGLSVYSVPGTAMDEVRRYLDRYEAEILRKCYIDLYEAAILRKSKSSDNYGLEFFIAGYDGKRQQAIAEFDKKKFPGILAIDY